MGRFIQIVEVGRATACRTKRPCWNPPFAPIWCGGWRARAPNGSRPSPSSHPKYVPQMAGAEEVMAALPHQDGRSRIGLVLNGKGYDRALASGVDEVNVSVAATDGFGLKNQGLAVKDQLAMLGDIVNRRHNAESSEGAPSLSAIISCVWGCPFDGEVSAGQVADMVGAIAAMGIKEIGLADTIGAGDPGR